MRNDHYLAAAVALSLTASAPAAFAQAGGQGSGAVPSAATPANPGSAGISASPGGASSTTTGIGSGAPVTSNPTLYQPGFTMDRTRSPGPLPGDDPTDPAYPGHIGQ